MILERLIMENFRQFRGRQEIVFSDLRQRNVTLIHAENGFGKTTLLKALLWCLYGRGGLMGDDGLEEDFEKPDLILHEGLAHQARDPESLMATVKLTFRHDENRYILTRCLTLAQQQLDPRRTTVTLEVMQDGQTFKQERPQQRIQAIIPDGIRRFLFFNGERINYLAMERNSGQVTEAIHQMLGLKLLQTTIDDLKNSSVRGRLRGEQKEATSDEKRVLLDRQSALEAEIQTLEDQRRQFQQNLAALGRELESVDNKLAANREAHELQNKRIRLTNEKQDHQRRLTEVTQQLAKLVSEDGYTLFTPELVTRGRAIVGRLRGENKIPARVLNTFIEELLDHRICICTRTLVEGSQERAAVERLLTFAGDQEFNNAVGALDHAIGLLQGAVAQTQQRLRKLNTDRLELRREIRNREEEINEIHQQLGDKKDEEVQQLEQHRHRLQLDRDNQLSRQGGLENKIDSTRQDLKALEDQIRQFEDKEEAAARAQRRVNAVEKCIGLLDEILKAETKALRPLLNGEIDRHFRMIIDRDYWAELTDDYTLRIRKKVGSGEDNITEIDAALSTGQRTVTSLVFIASLVSLASRRADIPTILKGLDGSAYPVVIDSPFGSLSMFRQGVAKYIPELAPQVMLLVSPEQYDGQVEKALNKSDRVGKRYYLAYHGPTIPNRANKNLFVNGQEIQQFFPSEFDEYTEIRELKL